MTLLLFRPKGDRHFHPTVDGRRRQEPAAKGLREVIYKDVRVVTKSRQFVCAFLTPEGSSHDYGELRALGMRTVLLPNDPGTFSAHGMRRAERRREGAAGEAVGQDVI